MSPTKLGLLITASLIVLLLAIYALHLHLQIKSKQKIATEKDEAERLLAQKNLDIRNDNIIADIRFIAQSLISGQCEMTEAVLRIHHLSDALDSDIMLKAEFSNLHNHFEACKSMAIKEAYKALSKKLRFQQDQQRMRLEQQNTETVLEEVKLISQYSFANLKQLH
jgi:Protein of unknown function (DUF2489)